MRLYCFRAFEVPTRRRSTYQSRLLHTIIGSARPRISAFFSAYPTGFEELSPTPEVLKWYNIPLLPFQNASIIIGII